MISILYITQGCLLKFQTTNDLSGYGYNFEYHTVPDTLFSVDWEKSHLFETFPVTNKDDILDLIVEQCKYIPIIREELEVIYDDSNIS